MGDPWETPYLHILLNWPYSPPQATPSQKDGFAPSRAPLLRRRDVDQRCKTCITGGCADHSRRKEAFFTLRKEAFSTRKPRANGGREAEASHRSTHRMQTAVHVAYRWRRVDANTGRRGRALMWTGLQARAALAGFGGCRSCARSRSPGRVPLQLLDLDGADLVLGGFGDAVQRGVGEPVGVAVLEVERHPRLARVGLARHAGARLDGAAA